MLDASQRKLSLSRLGDITLMVCFVHALPILEVMGSCDMLEKSLQGMA